MWRGLTARQDLLLREGLSLVPAILVNTSACTGFVHGPSQRRFFDLKEERQIKEWTHYEVLGVSKESSMTPLLTRNTSFEVYVG